MAKTTEYDIDYKDCFPDYQVLAILVRDLKVSAVIQDSKGDIFITFDGKAPFNVINTPG